MSKLTHQIDARGLNPGETFHRCGETHLPLRRVIRTRQVAIAITEILHGRADGHPGSLEYAMLAHGALVSVPIFHFDQ